jgi:phosphatidylinositol glycan class O
MRDNIPEQSKNSNRTNFAIGDDTWDILFPKQFETLGLSLPSFDLLRHEEQDEIVRNGLISILHNKALEFDFFVCHFLGIDHVGHIQMDSSSPFMFKKFQQMDDFLIKITESIDEQTTLIVVSDHGMTQQGIHGGNTRDESETLLLGFSKRGFLKGNPKVPKYMLDEQDLIHSENPFFHPLKQSAELYKSIPAIAMAPTLSLLMGLNIPFSSVGKMIPDFFVSGQ